MKGKYGTPALKRHQPESLVMFSFFTEFKNSVTSRVFPIPASAEIKMVLPFPLLQLGDLGVALRVPFPCLPLLARLEALIPSCSDR